jgi:stage V sporulation protein D (sporulation-specific penicillin-binding protein)
MSFGQSFQITPLQLATAVSTFVNGGKRITPHLGMCILDAKGDKVKEFSYNEKNVMSENTSAIMRELLESVVSEGTGKNAYIEGFDIGGKTATSQTLPRSANKYISSFVGFAPAENPSVLTLVVIYNPQGIYYGGTIAAPVCRTIFENILPYLGIEKASE